MKINIIVFGQLTEIIGNDNLVVSDTKNTDSLMEQLHKLYPALADTKFLMAVDKQLITANTILTNNSTIALLPPFSGG